QYEGKWIHRELLKAYAGFSAQLANSEIPKTIVTGNWGCGAKGGDPQLKAVIQLMACAAAGKNLYYCCEGDANLFHGLFTLMNKIEDMTDLTVGTLYHRVIDRAEYCKVNRKAFLLKELL
ncbi:hypothetical protein Ciccas_014084, partial [Cichlidogyrus casuarinus]